MIRAGGLAEKTSDVNTFAVLPTPHLNIPFDKSILVTIFFKSLFVGCNTHTHAYEN